MKTIEYSHIVRRKLKALKMRLTAEFGPESAAKALKRIMDSVKSLTDFEEKALCSLLCLIFILITDTFMYAIIICFTESRTTESLSWKSLMKGKILCMSCSVSVPYPRNPLIIGKNKLWLFTYIACNART